MQRNSGKKGNRILKISMITVAVIACLFAVLKIANVSVPEVANKAVSFVKNGFKFGAGTESDGTVDTILVNGTNYTVDQGTKTINASLPYTAEDMVTIDVTKKDDNQRVEGIGSAVLDNNNKITKTIKVTSADKSTTTTYTVNVTKANSNKLKSLTIAGVTLTPAFSPDVTTYTATVLTTINSLGVSATTYDKTSSVSITGADSVSSGTNIVQITVSNPNIADNITYTVTVTAKSSETNTYSYSGGSKNYKIPFSGNYQIQAWGAGGHLQGYTTGGAYTKGNINLSKDKELFIYVGGQGKSGTRSTGAVIAGGYNGRWFFLYM